MQIYSEIHLEKKKMYLSLLSVEVQWKNLMEYTD